MGSGNKKIVEERLMFIGVERAEGTGVDMCSMSSPVLAFPQSFTGCIPSLCTCHPSSTRVLWVLNTSKHISSLPQRSEVAPHY